MVRSAAAGLVQAVTSLSTRRIIDRAKPRARCARVCLSSLSVSGSEMNEVSGGVRERQTPGKGCPGTRVTAAGILAITPVIVNLTAARGAARVSVTTG